MSLEWLYYGFPIEGTPCLRGSPGWFSGWTVVKSKRKAPLIEAVIDQGTPAKSFHVDFYGLFVSQ